MEAGVGPVAVAMGQEFTPNCEHYTEGIHWLAPVTAPFDVDSIVIKTPALQTPGLRVGRLDFCLRGERLFSD